MRLVTWNCYRGEIPARLSRLAPLKPDVVALQECRRPQRALDNGIWRGDLEEQGVAVVGSANVRVESIADGPQLPATCLPVIAHTSTHAIGLMNLWTLPEPTYDEFALKAVRVAVAAFPPEVPVVVVGDFNSTPSVLGQRLTSPELLRSLRDEFGLVSAYHTHLGVEHGKEAHGYPLLALAGVLAVPPRLLLHPGELGIEGHSGGSRGGCRVAGQRPSPAAG